MKSLSLPLIVVGVLIVGTHLPAIAGEEYSDARKDELLAKYMQDLENVKSKDRWAHEKESPISNMQWLGDRVRPAEPLLLRELMGNDGDVLARAIGGVLIHLGKEERKTIESLLADGKISKKRAAIVFKEFDEVSQAQQAWTSGDSTKRREGLITLIRYHLAGHSEMDHALNDADPGVRQIGASLAGRLKLSDAEWEKILEALKDSSSMVRKEALATVLRDHDRSIPNLEEILISLRHDKECLKDVQWHLGNVGIHKESSVDALFEDIQSSSMASRRDALVLLAACRVNPEKVLPKLAMLASQDSDPSAKQLAFVSWSRILSYFVDGGTAPEPMARESQVYPILVALLRDNRIDPRIHDGALQRINEMGTHVDIVAMLDFYIDELHNPRESPRWQIGRDGVRKILLSQNVSVGEAFWTAWSKADEQTAKELEEILNSTNTWQVFQMVIAKGTEGQRISALTKIRECNGMGEEIIPAIIQCINHPEPKVRICAIETVGYLVRGGRLSDFSRITSLVEALPKRIQVEQDVSVRETAWTTFAEEANLTGYEISSNDLPGFDDLLREAAWDKNDHIRTAARKILGCNFGNPLPPPPGWWIFKVLTGLAGGCCLLFIGLAIWGFMRPLFQAETMPSQNLTLRNAARGAYATGAVLVVANLGLIGFLYWMSHGAPLSLPGIMTLLVILSMVGGGVTLVAWGTKIQSGRTLDCIMLMLLALTGSFLFGLFFITDIVLLLKDSSAFFESTGFSRLISDGFSGTGCIYILTNIIRYLVARKKM
jgi:hypothetical protein